MILRESDKLPLDNTLLVKRYILLFSTDCGLWRSTVTCHALLRHTLLCCVK
jgi:hypothetical protein